MLILNKNFKRGSVRLKISLLDDLWYLSHLITPGDVLTAKTERKLKLGDASEGRTQVVKKILTLSLQVLSVELEDGALLRVKGVVAKETTDVPLGAHHSFSLQLHDEFLLEKSSWPKFMQEKLRDAVNNDAQKILIVLFDREEALCSSISQQGVTHLAHLKPEVQHKQYTASHVVSIIPTIIEEVKKQLEQKKFTTLVFASPSFWHSSLQKELPSEMKKNAIFLTAHAVEKAQVTKLLARPELKSALSSQRLQKEETLVKEMLAELAKEMLAYGINDVRSAVEIGAIASLVVTENYVQKAKQENTFDPLDLLMQQADAANASVHIIYDEQTQKIIDGLGGIVGKLRWKV